MKIRFASVATFLLLSALVVSAALARDPLDELKARMDATAARFQSMTAKVKYLSHTEVLDDNSVETGSVVMKKVMAGDVQGKIDFVTPDPKIVAIAQRRLQIYYPKMKTVQNVDLGKHGEKLDQFIMIGFGTSGTELAKDYDMTVAGKETLRIPQAVQTIRLELIPRAGEAKQYVKKLELWIPESGDTYPVQEKVLQPSGDYRLVTYTDVAINAKLSPDALELKLPPNVKIENVGR